MSDSDNILDNPRIAVVSINSHRARRKLAVLLTLSTSDIPYFYSWERSGEWAAIPLSYADEAEQITGIKRVRRIADLQPCINFNGGPSTRRKLDILLMNNP